MSAMACILLHCRGAGNGGRGQRRASRSDDGRVAIGVPLDGKTDALKRTKSECEKGRGGEDEKEIWGQRDGEQNGCLSAMVVEWQAEMRWRSRKSRLSMAEPGKRAGARDRAALFVLRNCTGPGSAGNRSRAWRAFVPLYGV